jgi:hypothetical protein
MTLLGHGQGGPHTYVMAGETSPYAAPTKLDHGHGGAHAYVTAGRRTAANEQPCSRCRGTGEHPAAEFTDSFKGVTCPGCKGTRRESKADWAPTQLPEHQQAARDIPDWNESKRALLGMARERTPGTKVWRGEIRHKDDLEHPASVGLHWSADSDQIVTPAEDPPPGHHRVIWEAQIEHPDQAFDRSHPIWSGQHRSMDSESEVRFKPGAQVKITRRYVHDNSTGNTTFVPHKRARSDSAWQAHDMGTHVETAHKPTSDLIDYGDVGVHKRAEAPKHGIGLTPAQAKRRMRPTTRLPAPPSLSRIAFMPTQRLFGPTYGLDHRLFDGDELKGDVRRYIYETLATFWKGKHGCDWDEWAIVYLAGSEASEWTSEERVGNNDFDVLIGVNYDEFRGCHTSREAGKTDQEITDELNNDFKVLNRQTAEAYIPIDGRIEGPFSNTWYVNPDSYDIRKIKPYAAYDVTHMRWAVKPPHLPKWDISQFPEGPALVAECQAVSAYVRAILNMPEPYRTQQGYSLWHHLHSDRSRAFSAQGEGWYDPGNVIEKWLDQEGLWEQLVQIMVRVREHPESMNAPENWSNSPVIR